MIVLLQSTEKNAKAFAVDIDEGAPSCKDSALCGPIPPGMDQYCSNCELRRQVGVGNSGCGPWQELLSIECDVVDSGLIVDTMWSLWQNKVSAEEALLCIAGACSNAT